ncbi:hypothetical protein LguiA_024694 [Lonicera macranthoides]
MEDIDVVLHNSIPTCEINSMSPGLSIPSSKPEQPTPSDDRHLPHLRHHRIPSQNT